MISSTKIRQTRSIAVSDLESQRSFNYKELLIETIDLAVSPLGDSSKKKFYLYLERYFNMIKQDIPDKIEEFTIAIERIFGQGAKILEIEIMKNLFAKIGSAFEYLPEKDNLLFVEYVGAVREYLRKCTRK